MDRVRGSKKSRRLFLLFIGVVVVCDCSYSKAASDAPRPLSKIAGTWVFNEAYSDDFNGPSLAGRKWTTSIASWGDWSWRQENVRQSDGLLTIQMRYEPHVRDGKKLYYTSGIVKSISPKLYGYFEARIRAAGTFPGVCPAFWAYRADERQWTEIDFVELTQRVTDPRLTDFNTHVFRHPLLPKLTERHFPNGSPWRAPWDPRDAFHVYATRWTPDEIEWYVDGQSVAHAKNTYWHQPLNIVLSFGLREPLHTKSSSSGFPTAFYVDYVRVWDAADVQTTQ